MLLSALVLSGIGIAMVVSTTSGTPRGGLGGRQALFLVAGLLVATFFAVFDYRLLLRASPALFAASLLPLVWLPIFGPTIAGAKSWIRLFGGFQLQPSELARITTVLLLAWILENDDRSFLSTRTVTALAVVVALPMTLVLLQPDLGVALTYAPFLLAALYLGGLPGRVWGALVLAGALAAGASWFVLKDYQKDRIRTFLDPDLAARGAGYQVRQARIAIGSGGILGKGWKEGTQSRLGFLPVRHSDFIFAALAEERGFAGVATVVGLYGLFLARGIAIARDARDRGGSMLVLLVILNVVAQAAANIAMNVGLLPTTGITLPFVSYGGSSIIATWAMTGLVLSVAQRRFVNV
ncbi:MAG: rod shape-determining protein RodA [Holophagales bacterium]|nr:rod shape-determining protein RodA [Holophagales bacterium]